MHTPRADIFRAYGIRGVAGRDLDASVAVEVGRAFAGMIRDGGGDTVLAGRDCRRSSPVLAEALVSGLMDGGCDVLDAGMVATPVLYHGVETLAVDGGVQVTGSHSPAAHNGFKFLVGQQSLGEEGIRAIRERLGSRDPGAVRGSVRSVSLTDGYAKAVLAALDGGAGGVRVVVDAGNGTASALAAGIYRRLGCRVTEIHGSVDPGFPDRGPSPDPEALTALRRQVVGSGSDFGLAFDGDADRLVMVDRNGRVIEGDVLAWILAADLLPAHRGECFVLDVKCSEAVLEAIRARGGEPHLCRTGHPYVKERMRDRGAPMGAERSGHYYFADRFTGQDDGIYAGARLLEVLGRDRDWVTRRLAELPARHASGEIRHPVEPALKLPLRDAVAAELSRRVGASLEDGVRLRYEDGWGLVRASYSASHLTIFCEGRTPEALARIRDELLAAVAAAEGDLSGPGDAIASGRSRR